jgi:hypothetical protein
MRPRLSIARGAIFLAYSSLPRRTAAHSRWRCPEARSSDTGIKAGPCGDETDDFDSPLLLPGGDDDDAAVLEIAPGPMRVTFEESIHHTGAPFRISLSGESLSRLVSSRLPAHRRRPMALTPVAARKILA